MNPRTSLYLPIPLAKPNRQLITRSSAANAQSFKREGDLYQRLPAPVNLHSSFIPVPHRTRNLNTFQLLSNSSRTPRSLSSFGSSGKLCSHYGRRFTLPAKLGVNQYEWGRHSNRGVGAHQDSNHHCEGKIINNFPPEQEQRQYCQKR